MAKEEITPSEWQMEALYREWWQRGYHEQVICFRQHIGYTDIVITVFAYFPK